MKRMFSTPASGYRLVISVMMTARMNWAFFAQAVESHFTVSTPRSSETGSECFAVSDPW